jgi:hypothetical protein
MSTNIDSKMSQTHISPETKMRKTAATSALFRDVWTGN